MFQLKQKTSKEEFMDIYRSHHKLVRSIIFNLGIKNDVEDLVQQTFLQAWKYRSKIHKVKSLKSWLARIAINASYSHFRKQKSSTNIAPSEVEISVDDHIESRSEARDIVLKSFDKLSIEHRTILTLYYIEEFSLEEIANVTELPLGTVKSRLNRAKSAMKKVLKILEVA